MKPVDKGMLRGSDREEAEGLETRVEEEARSGVQVQEPGYEYKNLTSAQLKVAKIKDRI